MGEKHPLCLFLDICPENSPVSEGNSKINCFFIIYVSFYYFFVVASIDCTGEISCLLFLEKFYIPDPEDSSKPYPEVL